MDEEEFKKDISRIIREGIISSPPSPCPPAVPFIMCSDAGDCPFKSDVECRRCVEFATRVIKSESSI